MCSVTRIIEKTLTIKSFTPTDWGEFPFPDSPDPNIHVHPDAMCNLCEGSVSPLENRGNMGGVGALPFITAMICLVHHHVTFTEPEGFVPPLVLPYSLSQKRTTPWLC